MSDDGTGQARFTDPEGQTVALPKGTLFPGRHCARHHPCRQGRRKRPRCPVLLRRQGEAAAAVNTVIGKVPRRLADVKIPEGAEELVDGRTRIYYRAGFFDAEAKGQGEPAFEMSSVTLDNGIELYGTHEQGEGGIEYRITRLEPIPKPECK